MLADHVLCDNQGKSDSSTGSWFSVQPTRKSVTGKIGGSFVGAVSIKSYLIFLPKDHQALVEDTQLFSLNPSLVLHINTQASSSCIIMKSYIFKFQVQCHKIKKLK